MPNASVHIWFLLLCGTACVSMAAPAALTEADRDFFQTQVQPLLRDHCFKCHSHAAPKIKGGLVLDSLSGLLTGGDSGPAIVPGHPEESLLIRAVSYNDPDLQMPPSKDQGKPLRAEQVNILVDWVKRGAPWPATDAAAQAGSQTRHVTDQDRAWWAYQPITHPSPPVLPDDAWCRNPIDAFVLQQLSQEGLRPSSEADKRTLLRRVYFDLIGLPPTPAEVEAFLADASDQSYERVVDRLLDSPHYGERWARLWLDLVRYAESDGYKADGYRPQSWRYRDYVVASFNHDKPYDQFVREQLAGDELEPDQPEAMVATMFLRHWIYEYNNRDAKGQWTSILEDLTDVTADVFLGMGLSCARCHDHKYDPILQKDYYRMQAFFAPLLPREDLIVATAAEKETYARRLAAWKTATADIRARIETLEEPYRKTAARDATSKFPEDIQELLKKSKPDRTPYENQIFELAFRQITYEWDNLDAKIKGPDKMTVADLRRELAAFDHLKPSALPQALTVTDVGPTAPPTYIPKSRDHSAIAPGFPSVFGEQPAKIEPVPGAPQSTGRRAALARWLTRPDHPLTTRVLVNRIWQHHFGRGIVATTSDFGKLGQPPSHPALLDWLTTAFLQDHWKVKNLHRLIVTSATYRQSSGAPPEALGWMKDPDNRWLWRMPIRRLDADQIRDNLLAATGELDLDMGGPSVEARTPRRSIYTKVQRNSHDPLLAAFDAPDNLGSTARRNVTTGPTQALLMFNSPALAQRARALAQRVSHPPGQTEEQIVANACRLTLGREPETWELSELTAFLDEQSQRIERGQPPAQNTSTTVESVPGGEGRAAVLESAQLKSAGAKLPKGRQAALEDLCHVLLNSSEFLYVD